MIRLGNDEVPGKIKESIEKQKERPAIGRSF